MLLDGNMTTVTQHQIEKFVVIAFARWTLLETFIVIAVGCYENHLKVSGYEP